MRSIMNRNSSAARAARIIVQVTTVLAAIALVGCKTTPYPPAPQSAATPDYLYKIGPLDSVNVVVWRNPELSTSVPVRPDGKITAPLIEDLPALGKDSTTLARDVEKALSKYIRDPVVTVIVTSFNGPYPEQIRVVGEASKPQALPYRQGMTLLDVMIAVGGLQAIQRPAEGPGQARRHLGERGCQTRGHSVGPAELVLMTARRIRASRRPRPCKS